MEKVSTNVAMETKDTTSRMISTMAKPLCCFLDLTMFDFCSLFKIEFCNNPQPAIHGFQNIKVSGQRLDGERHQFTVLHRNDTVHPACECMIVGRYQR